MSTWVQNISWDSSAIGGMTTAAPATTTAAPTTAAPTAPPTVAPSYPMNPNYGGGGVIFPLPVAPSLLMDGDISALSPITPAPTTAAPVPETLAPIPPMPMPVMVDEDEDKPFWTWQKIALALGCLMVVGVAVWWFFLRKGKKNNGRGNNSSTNKGRSNNRGRNNGKKNNSVAAGYNYNDTLDNWTDYYNNVTPNGTNNAKRV